VEQTNWRFFEGAEMARCGGISTKLGVGGLTPMKEARESPPIKKPEVDKGISIEVAVMGELTAGKISEQSGRRGLLS